MNITGKPINLYYFVTNGFTFQIKVAIPPEENLWRNTYKSEGAGA